MTKYSIGSIICLILALIGAVSVVAFYIQGNAFEWDYILAVIYVIALPLYAHHLANELDTHALIFSKAKEKKGRF